MLCSKTKVVGAEIVRPTRRQIHFGLKQFWLNGRDNIHRNLVLQRKNIAQVAFKSISPKVRAAQGINQLARNANFFGCPAHTAGALMETPEPVRYERRGPVAVLTLCAPQRRNALSRESVRTLLAALGRARQEAARAVVLATGLVSSTPGPSPLTKPV